MVFPKRTSNRGAGESKGKAKAKSDATGREAALDAIRDRIGADAQVNAATSPGSKPHAARAVSDEDVAIAERVVFRLWASGVVNARSIEQARREIDPRSRLDQTLVRLGLCDETAAAKSLAHELGYAYAGEGDFPACPIALDMLPQRFVRESLALPIGDDGATLRVAMADPLDRYVERAIALKTRRAVEIACAAPARLENEIRRLYGPGSGAERARTQEATPTPPRPEPLAAAPAEPQIEPRPSRPAAPQLADTAAPAPAPRALETPVDRPVEATAVAAARPAAPLPTPAPAASATPTPRFIRPKRVALRRPKSELERAAVEAAPAAPRPAPRAEPQMRRPAPEEAKPPARREAPQRAPVAPRREDMVSDFAAEADRRRAAAATVARRPTAALIDRAQAARAHAAQPASETPPAAPERAEANAKQSRPLIERLAERKPPKSEPAPAPASSSADWMSRFEQAMAEAAPRTARAGGARIERPTVSLLERAGAAAFPTRPLASQTEPRRDQAVAATPTPQNALDLAGDRALDSEQRVAQEVAQKVADESARRWAQAEAEVARAAEDRARAATRDVAPPTPTPPPTAAAPAAPAEVAPPQAPTPAGAPAAPAAQMERPATEADAPQRPTRRINREAARQFVVDEVRRKLRESLQAVAEQAAADRAARDLAKAPAEPVAQPIAEAASERAAEPQPSVESATPPAPSAPAPAATETHPTVDAPAAQRPPRLAPRPPAPAPRLDVAYQADPTHDLANLGFDAEAEAALEAALRSEDGLILLCGMAGSGKMATLNAVAARLADSGAAVAALDRVAPEFTGGPTGAPPRGPSRRAVVGAVRSADDAEVAARAAMTGCLVVVTLDVPTAAAAAPQLIRMGVPPYLLASSLRAAVTQRAVAADEAASAGAKGDAVAGAVTAVSVFAFDDAARTLVLSKAGESAFRAAMGLPESAYARRGPTAPARIRTVSGRTASVH